MRTNKGFTLCQKKLIEKILEEHWDKSSLAKAPLPSAYHAPTDNVTDGPETLTAYLSLVGSLSYLAVGTKADIAYAANYMARFSSNPTPGNWKALKHIVNYVAATSTRCLHINPLDCDRPLECYSNAVSLLKNTPPCQNSLKENLDNDVFALLGQRYAYTSSPIMVNYVAVMLVYSSLYGSYTCTIRQSS